MADKFKMYKCFDFLRMSKEAQDYIHRNSDVRGNSSYINWYMKDEYKHMSEYNGGKIHDTDGDMILEEGDNIVTDWLLQNGATMQDDNILILVSW